jgi:hypothetical protein
VITRIVSPHLKEFVVWITGSTQERLVMAVVINTHYCLSKP